MITKLRLMLIILMFASPSFAGDLLPVRYKLKTGNVQLHNQNSLHWIDNSPVYLNPDGKGRHSTTFFYKAKDLNDVPHLEIRHKGIDSRFRVQIKKDKQWIDLVKIEAKNDKWVQNRYELKDGVTAFANEKGEVEIRINSIGKVQSLELDYFAITADQGSTRTAALDY